MIVSATLALRTGGHEDYNIELKEKERKGKSRNIILYVYQKMWYKYSSCDHDEYKNLHKKLKEN